MECSAGGICETVKKNSRPVGLKKLSFIRKACRGMTQKLIFSALMPASLWQFGEKRAGFIRMIRGAGSSGIAGIIWGEDTRMMKGRLKDGKHLKDIYQRLKSIVIKAILTAGKSNGKRFFIGRMTQEGFYHETRR